MRESRWDVELILFFGGEDNTSPSAKVRRAGTDIDGDIQSLALDDTTKFSLGMTELIVEAAKRPLGGTRVIVLGEGVWDAELDEFRAMVRFEEEATRIAVNYETQLIDAREGSFDSFHLR